MKRGDVWWVCFDPSVGTEIQKTRPAVIVSNDYANAALDRQYMRKRVPDFSRGGELRSCVSTTIQWIFGHNNDRKSPKTSKPDEPYYYRELLHYV